MNLPHDLTEQLYRCSRCGACLETCPSYLATGDESLSARGRAALIESVLDGSLDHANGLMERLSRCLGCLACADKCPAGVNLPEIILAVKNSESAGRKWGRLSRLAAGQLADAACGSRARLRVVAPLGAALKGTGAAFRATDAAASKLPALKLPALKLPALPPLSSRPLHELLPETAPLKNTAMRVAFFPGCAGNLFFAETGLAAVSILRRAGAEVIVPADLQCCGLPLLMAGDGDRARHMMAHNLNLLADLNVDAVVTACSSCALALKGKLPGTSNLARARDRTLALAAKVKDIHELLSGEDPLFSKFAGLKAPLQLMAQDNSGETGEASGEETEREIKAVWHEPCHWRFGLKPEIDPQKIIAAIPGVRYVEAPVEPSCCGGGGLFSWRHRDLALKIGRRRAGELAASGADIVLTACPSCRIQLSEMLSLSANPLPVIHTVELMAGRNKETI